MLDLSKGFKLKSDIVLKCVNEKYWALSTTTGNQYKLNEVSYFIMNELTETKNINEISDAVTKVYKVSNQEFESDCNVLIEGAVKSGLVEEVSI